MLKRVVAVLLLMFMATAAQAFTLTDTKGKVHRLSDYKGKWLLVNFWATWCPPCQEEIPDLIALHEDKKNNVTVIGVAMSYEDPKYVQEFADQEMISYPIVLGNDAVVKQIGPVRGLPTTYLFNPQGKIVAYNVGALTRAAVEKYISSKK